MKEEDIIRNLNVIIGYIESLKNDLKGEVLKDEISKTPTS